MLCCDRCNCQLLNHEELANPRFGADLCDQCAGGEAEARAEAIEEAE